ncbi:PAAR domain-containing protein [Paraburkholderia phenoliruptrix]|uniref:PAAR domain-containing protein n=1 Tax=Paraburkholderia phenoliruptrix TaxID=252970 RepID=UPI0001C01C38
MRRFYLKVGDKSSTGGTIIEGIPSCTHHGTPLTFLGAQVVCSACGSTGRIVPKGPRWPDNMMGKEAALDGDLCACNCYPHPVMLASQSTMSQSFESHHLTDMGFACNGTPLRKDPVGNFDERVRVLDGSGRPLSGVPFHIKARSGDIHKGVTDSEGYCPGSIRPMLRNWILLSATKLWSGGTHEYLYLQHSNERQEGFSL